MEQVLLCRGLNLCLSCGDCRIGEEKTRSIFRTNIIEALAFGPLFPIASPIVALEKRGRLSVFPLQWLVCLTVSPKLAYQSLPLLPLLLFALPSWLVIISTIVSSSLYTSSGFNHATIRLNPSRPLFQTNITGACTRVHIAQSL